MQCSKGHGRAWGSQSHTGAASPVAVGLPGGNSCNLLILVTSSLMREEDLSVCASLTSRRYQISSLGLADVPAHSLGLALLCCAASLSLGLPVPTAHLTRTPCCCQLFALPATQRCPKQAETFSPLATMRLIPVGFIFGQDSGETPNRAGSPSSYTPPHFFHVPDTSVHPDSALSSSRPSHPSPTPTCSQTALGLICGLC